MNGFSTETALCTMKVTNFSRLSKLIAKNTPDYVLGEHRTVGVDVGGSLGKVPCSEELARQIQGPGVSITFVNEIGSKLLKCVDCFWC